MKVQILKLFIVFALMPIVFFAVSLSFIMNDIAIMNPFNWVTPARFICVIWICAISLSILQAVNDAN